MYVWSERTENSREGNKNVIPSNYYLYDFHEVKLHVEKSCTVLVNNEVVNVNKNLNIYININDNGIQHNKLSNYTYETDYENTSTHINGRLGQLIIVEKNVSYYWTGLFQ